MHFPKILYICLSITALSVAIYFVSSDHSNTAPEENEPADFQESATLVHRSENPNSASKSSSSIAKPPATIDSSYSNTPELSPNLAKHIARLIDSGIDPNEALDRLQQREKHRLEIAAKYSSKGDGTLTEADYKRYVKDRYLKRRDLNGNGKIDSYELQAIIRE